MVRGVNCMIVTCRFGPVVIEAGGRIYFRRRIRLCHVHTSGARTTIRAVHATQSCRSEPTSRGVHARPAHESAAAVQAFARSGAERPLRATNDLQLKDEAIDDVLALDEEIKAEGFHTSDFVTETRTSVALAVRRIVTH